MLRHTTLSFHFHLQLLRLPNLNSNLCKQYAFGRQGYFLMGKDWWNLGWWKVWDTIR